eukprot:scaffold294818_cov14-Tisochrysis_lutea.AAC.1
MHAALVVTSLPLNAAVELNPKLLSQVFTTAIELPHGYFCLVFPEVKLLPLAREPAYPPTHCGCAATPACRPLPSLAAAACLTPTDPIIIHTVVKGAFAEYILPSRFRHFVSAESGLNDGTAL